MGLQQAVGTKLSVSADLPATWDEAGFTALTYTLVGRLNSIPDLDGTYDVASFDDLTTGEELKFADMMRAGEGTFDVGLATDDAGQTILEDEKGEKVSLEIELKDGTKYFRTAIITSFRPSNIVVGGVVQAEVGLAFEKTSVKVAAST